MNLLDSTLKIERPIPISILAIFMLIGFFVSLRSIIDVMDSEKIIVWYYYFSIFITICSLITAIGLLMMKRFAVYLYILYLPISLFAQYKVSGEFNLFSVIFGAFFISIMFKYIKNME
jgi:hypothetical protein